MGSTVPSASDPVPTSPPTSTQPAQVLWLTLTLIVLFTAGMVVFGYDWLARHDTIAEAPFQSGWGLILVTMGVLLRELTARGL